MNMLQSTLDILQPCCLVAMGCVYISI